jgi:predicted O-methyltransferase YrrM
MTRDPKPSRDRRSVPKIALTAKDAVVLGGILSVSVAISLVGWSYWKEALVPVLLSFGIVLLAALHFEMFRRINRSVVSLGRDLEGKVEDDGSINFHQVEALCNLLAVIKPSTVLPQTRLWSAWPDFLQTLFVLITERRPNLVLELGSGVSTLIAAYALKQNGGGRIISLDHLDHCVEASRRNIGQHGLHHYVGVVHPPLKPIRLRDREALWYDSAQIESLREIDLLIVDGPPASVQSMARYPALPVLFEKLAANAVILVDDAYRPDEERMVHQWLEEFEGLEAEFLRLGQGAYVLRRRDPERG